YTIQIGPAIKDLIGNQMDQNENGVTGESSITPAGDIFSGRLYFQPNTNHAPVLTTGANAFTFPSVNEDGLGGNAGISIASWLSSSSITITDADPGAVKGIAITSVDDSKGTWQYSQNSGTTWTAIPTNVSDLNALLLQASANNMLRFV